jgi:hypothetical protein
MAGASQDAVVAFPGQKIAFGTVLAARLLAKLGLDKACPCGCGVSNLARKYAKCAFGRRFARA